MVHLMSARIRNESVLGNTGKVLSQDKRKIGHYWGIKVIFHETLFLENISNSFS